MDFFIPSSKKSKDSEDGNLSWWQLSLIGVGCTIGTGFFLGSAIGIKITGPSIVFSFILAAIGTYIVYSLLAKMTVKILKMDLSVIMLTKPMDVGQDLAVAGIIGVPIS